MRALWRRRRVVIPFVLAIVCLIVGGLVPPVFSWLLTMAAFGLLLDAGLALMPTTGGMHAHRQ